MDRIESLILSFIDNKILEKELTMPTLQILIDMGMCMYSTTLQTVQIK